MHSNHKIPSGHVSACKRRHLSCISARRRTFQIEFWPSKSAIKLVFWILRGQFNLDFGAKESSLTSSVFLYEFWPLSVQLSAYFGSEEDSF